MKPLLIVSALCIFLCCGHTFPQVSLSREQVIGNWSQYVIDSTDAYLAIPDHMKAYDTILTVSNYFAGGTFEFHADGTFGWYAGLPGVEIGYLGTWTVNRDTIVLVDEAKFIPEKLPVRIIGPNKLECHWSYVHDGVVEHSYWFLEKWP